MVSGNAVININIEYSKVECPCWNLNFSPKFINFLFSEEVKTSVEPENDEDDDDDENSVTNDEDQSELEILGETLGLTRSEKH